MCICEICGMEIKFPNYIINKFEGMIETFYECAMCYLTLEIDEYNEFKDDFPLDSNFHIEKLKKINKLTKSLRGW